MSARIGILSAHFGGEHSNFCERQNFESSMHSQIFFELRTRDFMVLARRLLPLHHRYVFVIVSSLFFYSSPNFLVSILVLVCTAAFYSCIPLMNCCCCRSTILPTHMSVCPTSVLDIEVCAQICRYTTHLLKGL